MTGRTARWAELARKPFRELRRLAARPRVKKGLRLVLFATLGLFALYLVAANAILNYGGVEWFVNSSTDDAHLSLGSSHTWFPGRVEIRDLKVRFEDRNVQFELTVGRASGKLNLLGLAKKRLHFRALEADDVHFLFRHKVTSVAGNERRLLHFPHIEGFSDPPLLKPEPVTDKSKNWVISLENVRAHGVELWFMEYRYTGRADVTGAFELAPGRKLWVGPAHADFVAGELGVGKKRPMAQKVRGALDFRFRETNPDPIPGLEIFRQISAKATLDAELVDLEAANLYLTDASTVAVRRGAGQLSARLELADGRFLPQSRLSVRGLEDVHVVLPSSALGGRLAFDVEARRQGAEATRLYVGGSLTSATLSIGDAKASLPPAIFVRTAQGVVVTDNADVTKPWKIEEASFRVVDGRAEDLRALDTAPEKERVLDGGSGWFFAHAELTRNGKWSGALRADARKVRVRRGDEPLLLDGTLAASLDSEHRDLESGSLRDVALEISDARVSSEPELRVSLRAPRVEWSGFPPVAARGRATLTAPRLEPLLEVLGAPAILVSVWPDAPLDASTRFVIEDEELDVRLDLAKSGPFRAMGRLRVCSPAKGAFLVKSGAFSVGLSVRGGVVRIVPLAGEKWLAENAPVCPTVD